VRDADAVGEVERARAFEDDFDDALDRQQGRRRATRFERAAPHVLHDDVAEVLGDDGIVDLDDVRVRQLADERRLVEEQVRVELAALGFSGSRERRP
jgi:hypothetical protein